MWRGDSVSLCPRPAGCASDSSRRCWELRPGCWSPVRTWTALFCISARKWFIYSANPGGWTKTETILPSSPARDKQKSSANNPAVLTTTSNLEITQWGLLVISPSHHFSPLTSFPFVRVSRGRPCRQGGRGRPRGWRGTGGCRGGRHRSPHSPTQCTAGHRAAPGPAPRPRWRPSHLQGLILILMLTSREDLLTVSVSIKYRAIKAGFLSYQEALLSINISVNASFCRKK